LQLSFHSDIASLIDALFDYRLRPMRAIPGQLDIRASNLMLGAGQRAQAIATLAKRVALPPAQLDAGCLILMQMTRIDVELRHALDEGGIARPIHADRHWTREGRHAIGRLRLARRQAGIAGIESALIGCREAERYVDYIYDYGSHFISCLRMGDKYFQVLVCQPQRYALLQRLWLPWIGQGNGDVALQGLVNYLGDDWIARTGQVTSAGNHVFDAELWHAPGLPAGESLLAPLLCQARGSQAGWRANQRSVPIGVEFTPHSPYMEQQRATAWQQVYQGAMLQRFGDSTSWREGEGEAVLASPSVLARSIRRAECATVPHRDIGELTGIHPCLDDTRGDLFASRIQLQGERSWTAQTGACLLALTMDARSTDGNLPRLHLRDGVSLEGHFFFGMLRGALLVEHDDGRLDALFAGLRFAAGKQGRAQVSSELSRPDAATLARLRVPLLVLLTEAEARWARALVDNDPAPVRAIRGEVSWLLRAVLDSDMMHVDAAYREFWTAFYKRAALLDYCGPCQPVASDLAAHMEWVQSANALLFRLRLEPAADLPVSVLVAIDEALRTLIEQATPTGAMPEKAAIAALRACLKQLELACNRVTLASYAMLRLAEPDNEVAAVLLLTYLIQMHGASRHPPLASSGCSDERLTQITAMLGSAAHDCQLARLLSELAQDTVEISIDAPQIWPKDAARIGLTADQWRELPARAWTLLEPLVQTDANAAESLRASLNTYGERGSELAILISGLQRQWQVHHLAHWPGDFAEPASILQRVHLGACRLNRLLAGMAFSSNHHDLAFMPASMSYAN
jgi:hypothetical protein